MNDPTLIQVARVCAATLQFVGAVNIQCRLVDGTPVIFAISPRLSGGIPLAIDAGAGLPRMLVDLTAGRRVAPAIGRCRDNLRMASYETFVFIDGSRVSLPGCQPAVATKDVA